MVGGLLVSQALTLFTTPVVYLYLDRLSQWLNQSPRAARAAAAGAAADHPENGGESPAVAAE
jgi:HAE1 family hydrophobic/amphiphilic exporter-1